MNYQFKKEEKILLSYFCIYQIALPQAECVTRSNFKQTAVGLNSEFFFS